MLGLVSGFIAGQEWIIIIAHLWSKKDTRAWVFGKAAGRSKNELTE